jgi:hypothetical protein
MRISSRTLTLGVFGIAALGAACTASIASQQGEALMLNQVGPISDGPRARGMSDVLTAGELARAEVRTTVDAVRRLRPEFLRATQVVGVDGPMEVYPSVYLNGQYAGRPETLGLIALDAIEEIRYVRAAQARDWWGASCPCAGGVIYVRTKVAR